MIVRLSVLACLAILTAAAPGVVHGAELKTEDAQRLEAAVRGWLGGVLGPDVKLPERPVQLAPEGDYYRVLVPIPGLEVPGATADQAAIAAIARPQVAGRWLVEQIRIPSPAKLTIVPQGEAAAYGPWQVLLSAGTQHSQASLGPDLGAPSRLGINLTDFAVGVDGPNQRQAQHFDQFSFQMETRPSFAGRVDVTEEATSEGFGSEQQYPGLPTISVQASRLRLSAKFDQLSEQHAGPLLVSAVRVLGSLLVSSNAPGSFHGLHVDPGAIRALILALHDLATGGRVEEAAEELRIKSADFSGAARRAALEIGATSPEGLLSAWLALSIEGLSVPDLPRGTEAWVPRRLILRPSVSGLSVADLSKIAMATSDPNTSPQAVAAGVAALLAHGGATVGIDTFLLEIGPAEFEGRGKLLLRTRDDLDGAARITASGFDALLADAANEPRLAPLVGVLSVATKLARREGNRLVWNLSFRDGKLKVNGLDPAQALAPGRAEPQLGSRR